MEKLTVHRLLSELKTIDDRINKEISSLKPVTVKRGNNSLVSTGGRLPITEEEFVNNAKSSYQSIKDLIARKFKLKSALTKANVNTKVTIDGREYTVIEAIEMKSIMELNGSLYSKMISEMDRSNKLYESTSAQVDSDFERMLSTQVSNITNKSDIQKVRDEYMNTFYKQNEVKLIDPLKCSEQVKELRNYIDKFLMEIDSVLSEANATTIIEIE